jgi:hypothetical protein
MTPLKPSRAAMALLLLSSTTVLAQDRVAGSVTIMGRETGVMYDVPLGLAAELCGVDASRLTQTAASLTGAFAGSRLVLCDVPQEAINQYRLSPVVLAGQTAAAATPATMEPAGDDTASAGAATSRVASGDAAPMVRISVAGSIVEVTPEQAAEACDIDVETLRADAAALEAGAGYPVSASETGAADATTAPAASDAGATAGIGSPAAAEEVDPDATTTNDGTAMAAEGPTSGTAPAGSAGLEAAADPEVPLPTADAVCEISRDRAEELGLPAPD